jgi:osmotically-inducible protein OsmY
MNKVKKNKNKRYFMKNLFKCILILMLTSSCAAPLVFIGAGGAAAKKMAEERTIGKSVDDVTLWTAITRNLLKNELAKEIYDKVSIKVYEGRVMLAGTVKNQEDKVELLRIVWAQNKVIEVIDEVRVDPEGGIRFTNYAKDSWITTQIKTKFILNKIIQSVNYSVETIDSVVYLIGIAKNETELSLVTEIAGKVKGVAKVVSYVRLA